MSDNRQGPQLYRRSKRALGRPGAVAKQGEPELTGVHRITSPSNDLVKDMRGLQSKKERAATGLFLAEGLKLVTDAFAAGWQVETLAYCETIARQPKVSEAIRTAKAAGTDVVEVSEAVLEKISRRDNPQMVVGVIRQRYATLDLETLSGTWVALDGVKDPGNLGTIIRTIDSAGGKGVILIGDTTDPFAIEAVRATMGSIFHVPIVRTSTGEFFAAKNRTGVPVFGTHLQGAVDYRSLEYPEPAILLMGNEQSGLGLPFVEFCDRVIKIPMAGQADSLNLAVATALALYEMRRTRLSL